VGDLVDASPGSSGSPGAPSSGPRREVRRFTSRSTAMPVLAYTGRRAGSAKAVGVAPKCDQGAQAVSVRRAD
jgi:hypothetical protein